MWGFLFFTLEKKKKKKKKKKRNKIQIKMMNIVHYVMKHMIYYYVVIHVPEHIIVNV